MSKVYIGTSGFSYSHWKGVFYPEGLPQPKWFEYYCQYFKSVELNVSFYRLPKKEVFAGWRQRAGPPALNRSGTGPAGGFVFSIKGSRFITHIKKLKDCQESVKVFFEAADSLRGRTSDEVRPPQGKNVVLWQLPPGLKADSIRLESFLKILPKDFRHAFEFRNKSWLAEEIYKLLKKYHTAIVFQDYPEWPISQEITADFVYLRFHGRTSLYSSCYTGKELTGWAKKIKNWLDMGLDVYAYFNNDALGFAIPNARRLQELASQDVLL